MTNRKAKQRRIEMLGRISDRLKRFHAMFEAEASECVSIPDCDCEVANDSREFDGMLAAAEVDFDEKGEEPVDDEEDGPEMEQATPPTENSPLTQLTVLAALGKAIAGATAAASAEAIRRRRDETRTP